MSEENVELARGTFEAFNRTYTEGTDDLYALLDPDIEWIPATARRRRDRDKQGQLITYCQSRVEETRQLLNHIIRDQQARRD